MSPNTPLQSPPLCRGIAALALSALAALPLVALAQGTGAPVPAPAPAESQAGAPSQNQRIENIHIEDKGATVDELRVGGRTQSITVQPKANVPPYQVLPNPNELGRDRQGGAEGSANGNGPRVWNVLKF